MAADTMKYYACRPESCCTSGELPKEPELEYGRNQVHSSRSPPHHLESHREGAMLLFLLPRIMWTLMKNTKVSLSVISLCTTEWKEPSRASWMPVSARLR